MPSCICINSYKKIILIITDFDCSIKISTLKITIKYQFFIWRYGRIHSFENSWWFSFKIVMKFSKVCSHMRIITIKYILVFKYIISFDLLMHFKTICESMSYIKNYIYLNKWLFLYIKSQNKWVPIQFDQAKENQS